MTVEQGQELITLLGDLIIWTRLVFGLGIVCCGWHIATHFLRERTTLLGTRGQL